MKKFADIFDSKAVIGMIHVQALPGTPNYNGGVKTIIEKAVEEALIYRGAGVGGLIIENMHDVPYINRTVGPEITAAMSVVGHEVKDKTGLPCGIQILAGANKESLAAANFAGLDFIRAEGFVFSHIADEGLMNSDAGELLRYRKMIGAENILIFTDIKKKHSSHNITKDVSLADTAEAAEFFLSDGLIITGSKTGSSANIEDLKSVRKKTKLPILVGSGISTENIDQYFNYADAFIVGSHFKKDGFWKNDLDEKRISEFVEKFNSLKAN